MLTKQFGTPATKCSCVKEWIIILDYGLINDVFIVRLESICTFLLIYPCVNNQSDSKRLHFLF